LLDIDLKIILLDQQNNFVEILTLTISCEKIAPYKRGYLEIRTLFHLFKVIEMKKIYKNS